MSAMEHASPRPRQVTLAGWVIIVASLVLVVTVWQQIATLHTLTTRDAVESVLGEPPFDALGLDVEDVLAWIRVLSMIAGACATATAILGWQALQRSKGARVALSVLAVPLFLSGFGSGAVLSTAVALAVAWLWLQPARDWFDGVWRPEPPAERQRPTERPAPPAREPEPDPTPAAPPAAPPPYPGWVSAPTGPASAPVPGRPSAHPTPYPAPHLAAYPPPVGTPSPAGAGQLAPARRPGAVVGAAVLTWVFSAVAVAMFIFGVVLLLDDPQRIVDELNRQDPELVERSGVTVDMIRAVGVVMGVGVALWGIAACVLAALVVRRHAWARVLLLVSASAAGVVMLLGALAAPYLLVPVFACGTTVGLLLRGEVAAWFART